jgi:signal transduction histidine kinase
VAIDIGEDALVLDVVNPLRDGAPAGTGHGIAGMRERAALLGGGLSAGAAGGEFRVHASLPLRR